MHTRPADTNTSHRVSPLLHHSFLYTVWPYLQRAVRFAFRSARRNGVQALGRVAPNALQLQCPLKPVIIGYSLMQQSSNTAVYTYPSQLRSSGHWCFSKELSEVVKIKPINESCAACCLLQTPECKLATAAPGPSAALARCQNCACEILLQSLRAHYTLRWHSQVLSRSDQSSFESSTGSTHKLLSRRTLVPALTMAFFKSVFEKVLGKVEPDDQGTSHEHQSGPRGYTEPEFRCGQHLCVVMSLYNIDYGAPTVRPSQLRQN